MPWPAQHTDPTPIDVTLQHGRLHCPANGCDATLCDEQRLQHRGGETVFCSRCLTRWEVIALFDQQQREDATIPPR